MNENSESSAKLDSSGKSISGMMLIGVIMLVLIPLIVVVGYHLFEWHTAVALLPFAFWSFFFSQKYGRKRRPRRKPPTMIGRLLTCVFLSGTILIPIIANYTDSIEYMRLWAFAVALPAGTGLARNEILFKNRALGGLPASPLRELGLRAAVGGAIALLFVLLSEAIWHLLPLGFWIWFHAFGAVIFMVIWVAVFLVVDKFFPKRYEQKSIKCELPETTLEDDARSAFWLTYRPVNGSQFVYHHPNLEQCKAIVGKIDWADEYRQNLGAGIEIGNRKFGNIQIMLGAGLIYQCTADGQDTSHLFLNYWTEPRGWKLTGDMVDIEARNVPVNLIPEILDLVWVDDWVGVHEMLSQYESQPEPV